MEAHGMKRIGFQKENNEPSSVSTRLIFHLCVSVSFISLYSPGFGHKARFGMTWMWAWCLGRSPSPQVMWI